jgi:hypothetical protein
MATLTNILKFLSIRTAAGNDPADNAASWHAAMRLEFLFHSTH